MWRHKSNNGVKLGHDGLREDSHPCLLVHVGAMCVL